MKKAKLILAGIAVMAVAGGVYASKASRTGQVVYTRITPTTSLCTVTVPTATFTTTEGNFLTNTYATLTPGTCLTTHSIYVGF